MNSKIKMKKQVSKNLVSLLDRVLKVEANSTSCALVYQPKAPKELERFKNGSNDV